MPNVLVNDCFTSERDELKRLEVRTHIGNVSDTLEKLSADCRKKDAALAIWS